MIDAPLLTATFLAWIGCTLPVCQSVIDRADLYRAQVKGVVVTDQRVVIAPGQKVVVDGRSATISGYDPCGAEVGKADSGRCAVFGQYTTTALLDLILDDGSSTTELWRMRTDGSHLIISRPNGDVMVKLPVQPVDSEATRDQP